MKYCGICGQSKEDELFRKSFMCNECSWRRAYAKRKEFNRLKATGEIQHTPKEHPSTKICKTCLIEKSLTHFQYDSTWDHYACECRSCKLKRNTLPEDSERVKEAIRLSIENAL